jgi:hypothetical protein
MSLTDRLMTGGVITGLVGLGYTACSLSDSLLYSDSFLNMLREPISPSKLTFYALYFAMNVNQMMINSRRFNSLK